MDNWNSAPYKAKSLTPVHNSSRSEGTPKNKRNESSFKGALAQSMATASTGDLATFADAYEISRGTKSTPNCYLGIGCSTSHRKLTKLSKFAPEEAKFLPEPPKNPARQSDRSLHQLKPLTINRELIKARLQPGNKEGISPGRGTVTSKGKHKFFQ